MDSFTFQWTLLDYAPGADSGLPLSGEFIFNKNG
jgi:hypothetical protein